MKYNVSTLSMTSAEIELLKKDEVIFLVILLEMPIT